MKPTYANEHWFQLLQQTVDRVGRHAAGRKIGYSRTAVSTVLTGKYGVNAKYPNGVYPAKFAEAVKARLDVVSCPFLGESLATQQCRDTALSKAPVWNTTKMAHWKHCQKCPYRPMGDNSDE